MKRLFFSVLLLSSLAFPLSVMANAVMQPLGNASATLTLDPDPPQTGTAHATLVLSGASSDALSATTVTYGTEMSAMHMAGAGGSAHSSSAGRYTFDIPFGMAAAWSIEVHARGGVTGDTTFHTTVSSEATSQASSAAMHGMAMGNAMHGMSTNDSMHEMSMSNSMTNKTPTAGSMGSMAGGGLMPGMAMGGTGDAGPWRMAAFILLVIVLLIVLISRKVRTPWAYAVLALAGATAIAVAALQAHADAQPGSMTGMDMTAMSDVKGDAPVAVRTVTAVLSEPSARHQIYAPGTLAPFLLQDIVARSSGVIEDFSAYAGSRVTSGEVLARLNEPELAARADASSADARAQSNAATAASEDARSRAPANVVAAKAAVAAAKLDAEGAAADMTAKNERRRYWTIELQREQMLLGQGAISRQEFQDERAQAAAADADATMAYHRLHAAQQQTIAAQAKVLDATATENIANATAASIHAQAEKAALTAHADSILSGYTTVVAPSDGIVLKRLVDPGTYVQAGTVIAKIAVIDKLRIQANIAGSDLAGLRIGTPVAAKTSDGISLHGRITSIAPVADPSTRLTQVEAIVQNPGSRAIPGGFLRVALDVRSRAATSSIRVPLSAIVTGTTNTSVWRIVDQTAHLVPVHILSDDGQDAFLTGDIHPGDRIVVDGAPDLQQGENVSEVSP